jgi:hypothetical protein
MKRTYVPVNVGRTVTGTREGNVRENLSLPTSHPRYSFSLSNDVKSNLSPTERVSLCEDLAPHFAEAHKRWPGDEVSVEVSGVTYRMCAHVTKAHKVRVSY